MNNETPPQISVGETLRRARERAGQDLRYVADMLRIRYAYLEAIESGEYQKLPGAPYAIGFVRAYADHLNMNSVETVERFKKERADLDQQTQLVFPKPLPEGKVPSGGILLVAVTLGVIVYGAWFFLSGQDKPIVELIPEIPARLMAMVGVDDEPETARTDDVGAGPAETGAVPDQTPDDISDPVAESERVPEVETADVVLQPEDDTASPARPEQTGGAGDEMAESTPEPISEESAPEDTVAEETTPPEAVEEAVAETEEPVEPPVLVTEAEETPPAAEPVVEATPLAEADPEPAVPETAPAEPVDVAVAPVVEDDAAPPADDENASATEIAQRVLEELDGAEEAPADEPVVAEQAAAAEPTEAATPAQPIGPAVEETASAETTEPETSVADVATATGDEVEQSTTVTPDPQPGNATLARLSPARSNARVYGDENQVSRILITARVDSWVEVSTQQGELLLTRVLRAGDSFRVPDQAGLSLVTGNAGGLAISVDGNRVPDLGPVGAVRRGVELDPDRLKAGTAGNL